MNGSRIADGNTVEPEAQGDDDNPAKHLAAYSHSKKASDLHLCLERASASRRPARRSAVKQAWSLSNRLSEVQVLAIVDAYLSGATAARLAATHDLSLSSLKRILRSAQATKIRIGV